MVTELLVRLKTMLEGFGELIHLAEGSSRWDTVTRVSAERAMALAEVCSAVRPKLQELGRLLEIVEERARQEAEKLR